MSRLGEVGGRLYRGEVSIDFVGRRRRWYTISGAILLISIIALLTRGLNFSVDFKGGSILQFNAPTATLGQLHNAVSNSPAGSQAIVQQTGSSGNWQVESAKLDYSQLGKVENAITSAGIKVTDGFSQSFVGSTWGSEVSDKALKALIIFLVVIVIYLSIAFEWKMASAAFVALMHDILITVGVYALAGFTVSPASVIGLLTILGYSLYDTVVVFDKVRENTAGLLGSGKSTYSQAANLALNQTLVRSINTSLIALLPVAAILFIGIAVLGPGELQDLALVLFVGMMSGTYSSIFIATPVLADLKEREHQYKALAKRVKLRDAGGRAAKRQAAKGEKATTGGGGNQAGAAAGTPVPASRPTITIGRNRPAAGTAARPGSAGDDAGVDAGAADPVVGYTDEAQDADEVDEAGAQPSTTDWVPTAQGLPRGTPAPGGVRPGPRQQPRRTSAAARRPGGKKKKR